MKKSSFFSVLLLLISLTAVGKSISLTLHTATGDVFGNLLVPDIGSKFPLVILISGSGPTDRDGNNQSMKNNSLLMLADSFQSAGIASFRFDKRGIGESADAMKKESDLRIEDFINDVKGWITLLSKDKRFTKIIVAGHSEGSLIGMVASQNEPGVKKFISISGAGQSADTLLKIQLKDQPGEIKKSIYQKLDSLKQRYTIPNVPSMYYALFRPSVQGYLISWFQYDPQIEIKKLTIPVLIIQGTTDVQVSVDQADRLAAAAVKSQKLIIENMNHVLKTCPTTDRATQIDTYNNPDLPLATGFMTEIIAFIKK